MLAGATTSLLLAFILPVTLPGPASSIPDRLAGWGLASAASLFAVALLWPAPARDPLRSARSGLPGAGGAAARDVAYRARRRGQPSRAEHQAAVAAVADAAVDRLHKTFFATPYRPTGLSTAPGRSCGWSTS